MKKLVLLFLSFFAVSAYAGPIATFDDPGLPSGTSTPFESGGLLFSGSNSYAWNTNGGSSDNGTQALIIGYGGSATISKVGGGLFTLNSLDAGLSWYTQLDNFTITVGSETITLGSGYQNYAFTTLTDQITITIQPGAPDGYIAIDNIQYSVPEPTVLGLLGLGLVTISLSRRRRVV